MSLTAERAVELLEKAVEKRGKDYVYPSEWKDGQLCRYVNSRGEPACIAGQVFADAGILRGKARELWGRDENNGSITALLQWLGKEQPDTSVVNILEAAQSSQDSGLTWGVALANAKEEARMRNVMS